MRASKGSVEPLAGVMDPDAFAAHVEDATRKAGFRVESRESMHLTVEVSGRPVRCDLAMAYSAYRFSPNTLDDLVQAHLGALHVVPAPELDEAQAATALVPLLNRMHWLEQMHQRSSVPLAHRPLIGDLVITYVFDLPQHRIYVNADMLSRILRTPVASLAEIHQFALDNLQRRTSYRDYQTHGLGDKTILFCEARDGFAATRVLLEGVMREWSRRIPGRMLVGIPNRDFLIAISDRDQEHVAAIAHQVRRDSHRRDHPLCGDLLVWQDGQLRKLGREH